MLSGPASQSRLRGSRPCSWRLSPDVVFGVGVRSRLRGPTRCPPSAGRRSAARRATALAVSGSARPRVGASAPGAAADPDRLFGRGPRLASSEPRLFAYLFASGDPGACVVAGRRLERGGSLACSWRLISAFCRAGFLVRWTCVRLASRVGSGGFPPGALSASRAHRRCRRGRRSCRPRRRLRGPGLPVALLGSRSTSPRSCSSNGRRRVYRSGLPGGGCHAPSWRPGTRWGPLALVVSCRCRPCFGRASGAVLVTCRGVVFGAHGSARGRGCRRSGSAPLQGRFALRRAVPMGSAVRGSDREFRRTRRPFESVCTRSLFDVVSAPVGRRRRSFPLYCKPCSRRRRGCVVGAVQRRFGVVCYGV